MFAALHVSATRKKPGFVRWHHATILRPHCPFRRFEGDRRYWEVLGTFGLVHTAARNVPSRKTRGFVAAPLYRDLRRWQEGRPEKNKSLPAGRKALKETGVAGFEPTTPGFGGRCSTTELYSPVLPLRHIRNSPVYHAAPSPATGTVHRFWETKPPLGYTTFSFVACAGAIVVAPQKSASASGAPCASNACSVVDIAASFHVAAKPSAPVRVTQTVFAPRRFAIADAVNPSSKPRYATNRAAPTPSTHNSFFAASAYSRASRPVCFTTTTRQSRFVDAIRPSRLVSICPQSIQRSGASVTESDASKSGR